MKTAKPLIISVDDDPDCLLLIKKYLTKEGYDVITLDSPLGAAAVIEEKKPDLILLEVIMPEINGYELCGKVREREENIVTPVVFLSSLGEEQDKVKAFALGASDYIQKPITKRILVERVRENLLISAKWREVEEGSIPLNTIFVPAYFTDFKKFLCGQLNLSSAGADELEKIDVHDLYEMVSILDIQERQLAQYVAAFTRSQYMPVINPEDIKMGVLPPVFCRNNLIIPLSEINSQVPAFVLCNPFNWAFIVSLDEYNRGNAYRLYVTEPQNILPFLKDVKSGTGVKQKTGSAVFGTKTIGVSQEKQSAQCPINSIADKLIHKAVIKRANEIYIEPTENNSIIRFRIDGSLEDIAETEKHTGIMLLNYFKAVAGLNTAEKMTPQEGSIDVTVDNRNFRLKLATTLTPNGEEVVIKLLEPDAVTLKPAAVPEAVSMPESPVSGIEEDEISATDADASKSARKSILVIDDDEDIRTLLDHYLRKDYAVDVCEDGVNALLKIGENNYDLIICDINMPHLDGYQLLKIMKQQKINIPVIYLTSLDSSSDEARGLNMGAADYVKKPIALEVLGLRVKKKLS